MSELVVLAVAGIASAMLTPVAICVACRTGFYDRPRGYRKHAAPTPFLGGAAVLAAFIAVSPLVGGLDESRLVLLAGAAGLWAVGTLDDRITVAPRWRVLAAVCAALALGLSNLGFRTSAGEGLDIALTVLWIAGLVNAFNLMDNLDGACGTVAATSAVGIGVLGVVSGQALVAGLAFALAGACLGFLPWNLAGPARIFLGDGGSMTIGFLVAALAMAASRHLPLGDVNVLVAGLPVGVAILDTTLVSVSRTRRGVSLVTGGRDHLSHRLLLALGSPLAVAAALAALQAALCGAAIAGEELGVAAVLGLASAAALLGAMAIFVLDLDRWRPSGIAYGPARLRPHGSGVPSAGSIGIGSG